MIAFCEIILRYYRYTGNNLPPFRAVLTVLESHPPRPMPAPIGNATLQLLLRVHTRRANVTAKENRRRERVVERLLDVESYLHDTIVKIYIYIIYNIHHLLYSSLYTIIPHHPHFIYISVTYFTTLSYTHPRGEGGGLTSELLELPEHMNSSKYCKFCPYMP